MYLINLFNWLNFLCYWQCAGHVGQALLKRKHIDCPNKSGLRTDAKCSRAEYHFLSSQDDSVCYWFYSSLLLSSPGSGLDICFLHYTKK